MNKPVLIALYLYPEASRAKALLPEALDILESYADLAPDAWGTEENEQLPYDRKELLKNAGDPAYVLLYRSKKVIKYSGYFDLGNIPFINFKFDKSTPAKKWPQIGELADRLAVVAKARYGLLNIFWPAKAPWVSDRDRLQRWLTLAAQPVPIRFSASGPTGLGLRTYLGPELVKMIGSKKLLSMPGRVAELEGGMVRVDLAENPWELDPKQTLDLWLAAMEYLEPSGVLARPDFGADRMTVDFEPSSAWTKRVK